MIYLLLICLICLSCPQLVVSLLFLAATASLAVTLGEDFGPSKDPVSATKNPGVFYANPVLYAVTWVNIAGFTFIYLLWCSRWRNVHTDMYSLLDPCAVVSGRSEAEWRSCGLRHTLRLLAASCSVRYFPFPDPPTGGTQAGMSWDMRSSWEQSIRRKVVSLLGKNHLVGCISALHIYQ